MIIINKTSQTPEHSMSVIRSFIQYNQHTLKKTLSYYIMHIIVAMSVAYAVTGNLWMALTLSFLEPSIQAIAFFFHEKIWLKRQNTASPQAVSHS